MFISSGYEVGNNSGNANALVDAVAFMPNIEYGIEVENFPLNRYRKVLSKEILGAGPNEFIECINCGIKIEYKITNNIEPILLETIIEAKIKILNIKIKVGIKANVT